MEPYLYTGNNPIMFIDPTGMNHHDYELSKDRKGGFSLTLIKETDDNFHRIYNEDHSENITVSKDFIDNAKYMSNGGKVYPLSGVGAKKEVAEHIFNFFADNTIHEYSLSTFKDTKTSQISGFISTSFETGTEGTGGKELDARMDINPNLILTRDIHSHPNGGLNSDSDYPSGFALNKWNNPGMKGMTVYSTLKDDAKFYHGRKIKYGNRIPNNFEIRVPKAKNVKIFYNDKKASRTNNGVPY